MDFFNQNDFKYIIKRIIIIVFAFFIISGLKSVLGYEYTSPNGVKFEVPPVEEFDNDFKLIMCMYGKNNSSAYLYYIGSGAPIFRNTNFSNYVGIASSVVPDNFAPVGTFYDFYRYAENNDDWELSFRQNVNTTIGQNFGSTSIFGYEYVWSNHDIYQLQHVDGDIYTKGELLFSSDTVTVNPYIVTDENSINNWTFDELVIDCGNYVPKDNDTLIFNYNGNEYSMFFDWENWKEFRNVFHIPRQSISNYIVFQQDADITFEYGATIGLGVPYKFELGSYNISISEEYMNELNDNADRNVQNAILDKTEETNKLIGDLNNNLTSSDIDEDAIAFPTIDVQDGGVLNAMASFFDKIYNAFTNGTLLDIVIPIPFTSKNIVIPYDYTETQLRNANASWIIDIIQLGWWYIIGRYIIINLFEKVILMMRGSIDRVQMNNITTKLL